MRMFRPDAGAFVAEVDPTERALLLEVVDDVVSLLGGPAAASPGPRLTPDRVEPPSDPAVRRLLPDASGDPEAAAELRRLTEQDVRATKTDHLTRLRACIDAAGPDLVVVPSEAPAVAAALTDVRLVLAERLGVRTDEDSEAVHALVVAASTGRPGPPDGSAAGRVDDGVLLMASLHVALGMLQESLVELMLAGLDSGPAPGPALGSGL